ncbi:transcription elongation factor A N-terminal and central domain-containing protein [Engraulis encrasicolus]|uniref:transcription elongation factor A N-terminal and central domain-containing protein n=1 Tax=Engraulis encrasicolus TaxID=184585 RepID=UPI002FD22A3A
MDSNELIRHGKEIEKLHTSGNYSNIPPLLALISEAHVSFEQLENTGIAHILYRLVKSCPETGVRKACKALLSKWKTLYRHGHKHIYHQESHADEYDKPKGGYSETTDKLDETTTCGLASGDAAPCLHIGEKTLEESPGGQAESQRCTEITTEMLPHETHDHHVTKESSSQDVTTAINSNQADLESSISEITSEQPCPVRKKCTQLLQQALTSDKAPENTDTNTLAVLACSIEHNIHATHSTNMPKYKACVRSKVANLRNPKCLHLREGLLSGTLTPQNFVQMSAADMAGEELRKEREVYVAAGINEHQLPSSEEGTPTSKLRCRRCQGMDCRVTQISRGTLFLPSWVRQGNPGEEAMTFVTCAGCGQQWYQSGWVCF